MLDLSRSVRGLLDGAIGQARRAQHQNRWLEAARAWEEAARLSELIAQSSPIDSEKQMRTKAAKQFRLAAEKLRCIQAPTKPQVKAEGNSTSPKSTPSELTSTVKSFQHQSNVSWDQIAGLDNTVRAIQSAYALNLARAPEGVSLRSNRNILFYGPPGCGKSLLAAAASHGLDAVFFNVPVSGLVSKWFGESAKLVSALYQEARQHPSSIVFLDEIDALAGDRELKTPVLLGRFWQIC